MKITDDIIYIGVNDRKLDLFEGQYIVPEGMAYISRLSCNPAHGAGPFIEHYRFYG